MRGIKGSVKLKRALLLPAGAPGKGRECCTTRPSADWLMIFSADSVCIGDDTSTSAHLLEEQRQHSRERMPQAAQRW